MIWNLKWIFTDFFEIRQASKFVKINYERLYCFFNSWGFVVVLYFFRVFLEIQVITWFAGHQLGPLLLLLVIVNPFYGPLSALPSVTSKRLNRTHLGVYECVTEQQLIAGKRWPSIWEFIPSGTYRNLEWVGKSRFVGGKLIYESRSDFQIRTSGI